MPHHLERRKAETAHAGRLLREGRTVRGLMGPILRKPQVGAGKASIFTLRETRRRAVTWGPAKYAAHRKKGA